MLEVMAGFQVVFPVDNNLIRKRNDACRKKQGSVDKQDRWSDGFTGNHGRGISSFSLLSRCANHPHDLLVFEIEIIPEVFHGITDEPLE